MRVWVTPPGNLPDLPEVPAEGERVAEGEEEYSVHGSGPWEERPPEP